MERKIAKQVSLVVTVLNEEKSLPILLSSILTQTHLPSEVILVDGGSTDDTVEVAKQYKKDKYFQSHLHIFVLPQSNRSKGRNFGIDKAKGEIVALTDAGCILERNWFWKITEPFTDSKVDVVSGYYMAKPASVFQTCLVPYVLVMPDKVNPKTFLPSTRSMALKKSVWLEIGGFPERFSRNEDYVFSRKLLEKGCVFRFAKEAIVYWLPRKNLKEALRMFFSFASGDAMAGIYRPKVLFIFFRYLIFVFFSLTSQSYGFMLQFILGSLALYSFWSVAKNYRYVNNPKALFLLPVLQITSDIAVMIGTLAGTTEKVFGRKEK